MKRAVMGCVVFYFRYPGLNPYEICCFCDHDMAPGWLQLDVEISEIIFNFSFISFYFSMYQTFKTN